jgi:glycerophosphoryl diester phosphodiesterase
MKNNALLMACVLVLALSSGFLKTTVQTKVIAHRGFSSVAPENTLIAFQKAIDCNADYFELDVHKTKDDSLVVIHDSSVDKTSSNCKSGKIAEMTYAQLCGVRVGYSKKFGDQYKDEKIPTVREALEMAKGEIKVCIEVKVNGIEDDLLRVVNELGVNDQVIVFSFQYSVLEKIRKLDKNIPILYLVNSADCTTMDDAQMIQANAIGVGNKFIVTRAFLELAHDNGVEVWKWTVNNEEEMQQCIHLGIDGLITDFPEKALEIVKNYNR